jgi:Mn-dependent DtxR family transcriptional regulator
MKFHELTNADTAAMYPYRIAENLRCVCVSYVDSKYIAEWLHIDVKFVRQVLRRLYEDGFLDRQIRGSGVNFYKWKSNKGPATFSKG